MRTTIIFLAFILLSSSLNGQSTGKNFQPSAEKKNVKAEKLEKVETDNDGKKRTYLYYNNLGVRKITEESDSKGALKYFRKALELKPDCKMCLTNLGRSLLRLKRYDEAIEVLEKITTTTPGYAEAYASLGEALSYKGRAKESLIPFRIALKIIPNDPFTLTNYAISLHDVGEYELALRTFDKAIEIRSDLAEAHSNRGLSLFKLGRYSDALKSLEKANKLSPNQAQIHNNLGVVYDHIGKEKKARKFYLRAVELDPGFGLAQYNLASHYVEGGDRKNAFGQLKVLNKLDYNLAKDLRTLLWKKHLITVPSN